MKKNEVEEIEILFNSKGVVLGNLWGGGKGTYPSNKLRGFDRKKDLIKEAEKKLKDGSLDSGMGFEKLIGAALEIEIEKTIKYKNKKYKNISYDSLFIGEMTESESDFLADSLNSW